MRTSSAICRGAIAAAAAVALVGSAAPAASAIERLNASPTHLGPTGAVRITFVTPRRLTAGETYSVSLDYQKLEHPPGCTDGGLAREHVVAKGRRIRVVLRPHDPRRGDPYRKWCVGRYFASVEIDHLAGGTTSTQGPFAGRDVFVHR